MPYHFAEARDLTAEEIMKDETETQTQRLTIENGQFQIKQRKRLKKIESASDYIIAANRMTSYLRHQMSFRHYQTEEDFTMHFDYLSRV